MLKNLIVTSSPHIRAAKSTRKIMQSVCLALLPAGIASIVLFGWSSLAIIVASVLSCVVSEYVFERLNHRAVTIGDWSAVVTGLILAYNIPANAPLWIPVAGGIIAIALVKQCFGGIGGNFMNPAAAARAIMFVGWSAQMSTYPITKFMTDATAGATPLAQLSGGQAVNVVDLLLGNCGGTLGETCKIAIILGGLYLLITGIADWRIPAAMIGGAFACFLIKGLAEYDPATTEGLQGMLLGQGQFSYALSTALMQILSGGLMLGAFFMATDYVTSPMSALGKVIFGLGCGALVFVIRCYASYPEGCSFAILFMNVLTPLIDRFTAGKSFGGVKLHG